MLVPVRLSVLAQTINDLKGLNQEFEPNMLVPVRLSLLAQTI